MQALIDNAPNCRPEKMLLDIKQADLQSYQKNSLDRAYWVVFSISHRLNWEKSNKMGLKATYKTQHFLALDLKVSPSLAFEKQEMIGESYDFIGQEIQNVCDRNCLKPAKKSQ